MGSKNISASIPPFFDTRIRLLWTPSVDGGGRKNGGMDREGSINHDPLILSFARFKLTKLEGLMLGIVENRSVPSVTDDIDDRVSVLSRYEGGGLSCLFRIQENKSKIKISNIRRVLVIEAR